MTELKKAVLGVKRMTVMLVSIIAITTIAWMAKPDTGEMPMPIVITAMTLIAAMGGVDVWKQAKLDKYNGVVL
jgi:hypothetical protein